MKNQVEEAGHSKEVVSGFRLSPQQRRVWLLQQSNHAFPDRVSCVVAIEGPLDTARLRAAVKKVVSRHEILRTNHHSQPGMKIPLQLVSEASIYWEPDLDLSGLEGPQQARLEVLLCKHGSRTLRQEILQLCCVELSSHMKVLLISLPLLCADAKTLQNLVSEIGRSYNSEEFSDEPVQYAVVSEWLNELLESGEAEAGKEYWRGHDHSAWPGLILPFEKKASEAHEFEVGLFSCPIHHERAAQIKLLCKRYRTTPDAFLLACWQVFLFRMSGQPNVVVETAFDGRADEELKELLGPLTKYLPMHSRLRQQMNFVKVLEEAQAATEEARKWHECFNWEHSNTLSGAGNSLSPFPVAFDYEECAKSPVYETSFSIRSQFTCSELFKLKLVCLQTADSLTAEFHYHPAVFSLPDIESLAGRFGQLLESICHDPEAAISELEIITAEEKARILYEFNRPTISPSDEPRVHQLFEEQAARTPDAVALVFGPEMLTYQELNERANQLAHQLLSLGVGPESVVALLQERSTEMVISVLAVLKAGGAYLPLDPGYPEQRLSFMLADGKPAVLLLQRAYAGLLEVPAGMAVIVVDEQTSEAAAEMVGFSSTNPDGAVSASNLAYVIYTSGSTGQPKGVMVSHGGLSNYLSWSSRAYNLSAGRGTPLHSSLSFDLSVTALFNPLITGGWVHLLAEERGVAGLSQALRAGGKPYSLVKITPAHLAVLRQSWGGEKAGTECFVIGGEALSWEEVRHWRAVSGATRLINEYGPTETVVGCCVYQAGAGESEAGEGGVPIGQPIENMQMYVFDEQMNCVPVGVSGELYIGGIGLARGYRGRPELTAERFVPHPYSLEAGARLYRTGDAGRYLESGELEYQGRVDSQVNLRGYRIELGEIEAVLRQHEAITDAAVVVRESASGEKQLVAYLVGKGDASALSQLQVHLKARLPDYMMPTVFVQIDSLPLTSNGKVDRTKLPVPDQLDSHTKKPFVAPFVAPRTPFEEQLATIWQKLLKVDQVGVHDNFFELGGHSLIATQLALRVQETFDVSLTLQLIFDNPTINDLAAAITMKLSEAEDQAELDQMLEDLKQLSPEEIKVLLETEG